ncbi:MAG: hypothetical protein GC153_03090 [Alphaproteobacteria bacterium]|nr:hypothetical protein [Alphaproteobacteria bacterium]
MEFDEKGLVVGGPLEPANWAGFCPEQPVGMMMALGAAPPGVVAIRQFLPIDLCAKYVAECESKLSGNGQGARSSSIDSQSVNMGALMRHAFAGLVSQHYNVQIEGFEAPMLLRYRAGSGQAPHADAESWDAENRTWRRNANRDYSLVLFLNENFEGGQLYFPNFDFGMNPVTGLLVAFPSDHRYVVETKPVTSGVSYVVASWGTAKGSNRVQQDKPSSFIRL